MADKEKLQDMLDAFINNDEEKARGAFHSYTTDKCKEIVHDSDNLHEPDEIVNTNKNDE